MDATAPQQQDAYGRQLLGELLAKVLQYVPQEQRLSSCALVSRSWHTTALAATSSVSISSCMKLPAFQRYVSKHGNLLSSVCITNGYYWADASEALCIPFEQLEKLQSLQLTRVGILQGESGHKQQRAGWSCLTALSSLHLQRVVWQPPQPFAELSTLTCLKDLYLDLTDVTYHEDMRECINTAMACLTQLTNLGLKFKAMEDKDMTNLANLMHLRNWYLGNGRVTANALQVVPPSVTSLELFAMGDWRLDPVATPHVPLLTNLRTLDVQCVSHWDPNILLDMPRLSRLLLNRVNMLQQGDASTPQGGLKTLLAVLQKLTNLEHLVILEEQQKDKPYTEASLVLNTGLTHLDLTCSSVLWECIKRGMFRNNLQLQMLQFLKLGLGYAEKHLQPIESTGDLQNIVHGCPMLQELWLVGAWNPDHVDVQLTPLKQLSGLTQLAIGGYKLETSWLEGTITDMVRWTRLKDLCFRDVDDLGEVMLGLRRLTQLTSLEFSSGCYITPDETERDKEIAIERHIISRANPSDVWKQLENICWDYKVDIHILAQERIAAHALLQRQVEEEREVRAAQEEHVLQLQQALEEVKATQQGQLSHRQQVMEQLEIDQRKQVSQIQKEVQLLRSLVTDVVVVLIAMVVLLAFTYLIWL